MLTLNRHANKDGNYYKINRPKKCTVYFQKNQRQNYLLHEQHSRKTPIRKTGTNHKYIRQVRNLQTRMPHMQYEVQWPNWTTISNPIPGTSEGLQIQQLQIQIRPTPPRKTTFNRQNGEHHERITHKGEKAR